MENIVQIPNSQYWLKNFLFSALNHPYRTLKTSHCFMWPLLSPWWAGGESLQT